MGHPRAPDAGGAGLVVRPALHPAPSPWKGLALSVHFSSGLAPPCPPFLTPAATVYLKILRNQDRFWVNADGQPVRTLAEFFGHASAWMRDVLCDLLRQACGRDDNRPTALPLDGGPSDTGPLYDL